MKLNLSIVSLSIIFGVSIVAWKNLDQTIVLVDESISSGKISRFTRQEDSELRNKGLQLNGSNLSGKKGKRK